MLTGSTRRTSLAILAAIVAAPTVAASMQAQAHSSSCTPAHLTSALKQVEAECGSAKVVSTHRPGARIRGTGHISQHALCDGTHGAIDAVFSNRSCALSALRKTNYTIITYGRSSHIHIGTDGWRNGANTHVARRNTTTGARVAARQRAGSRTTARPRNQNDWRDASWSGDASWTGGSNRTGRRTRLSRASQTSNTNWSSDW